MRACCGLLLACAGEAFGAAFPATTYGDKLRPLVSSKKIQKLITTEGLGSIRAHYSPELIHK
jgi:hypothetical protein